MEQDAFLYLGLIALVGIVLKVAILFNIRIKSQISESFAVVCLFFLALNVSEFLGYFTYNVSEQLSFAILHMYMISAYFVFPAVLVLVLSLVEYKHLKVARLFLYSISALISAAQIGGFVIEGFKFIGWANVTTPGQYYWAAVAYPLLVAVFSAGLLLKHVLANNDFEVRCRCKVNLFAFAPMLLVLVLVLLFRLAGFKSSTALTLPLATMFFLFVMLLQSNGNIFWASLRMKILISVLTLKNINTLDMILGNIEKIRITEALRASNGMQRNAAKLLNVPASTLNKKIAKYKIVAEDYQGVSVVESIRLSRLASS
ncbi:MAG: hypothetical protein O3C29_14915 [Proteobacteria bacterium]|nr:hypothetical protein [Pseudomonadota bacterium]MDA1291717.1 hypothetical protein [Pseudomonadota bacterium]